MPVLPSHPTIYPAPVAGVSDTDEDGIPDARDACPEVPGWAMFKGCPPKRLFQVALWIVIAGGVGTLGYYGYSLVRVRILVKPPEVYVAAVRRGKVILKPVNVQEVGTKHWTNKVKIGSDPKKALIQIIGLRPVEFTIQPQKDKVVLLDAITGFPKGTFRHLVPESIETSNPEITLWIGSNLSILKEEIERSKAD